MKVWRRKSKEHSDNNESKRRRRKSKEHSDNNKSKRRRRGKSLARKVSGRKNMKEQGRDNKINEGARTMKHDNMKWKIVKRKKFTEESEWEDEYKGTGKR